MFKKDDKSFSGCTSSGMQHFRRPETSFCAGVTRGVVDKIHRFDKKPIVDALLTMPLRSSPLKKFKMDIVQTGVVGIFRGLLLLQMLANSQLDGVSESF